MSQWWTTPSAVANDKPKTFEYMGTDIATWNACHRVIWNMGDKFVNRDGEKFNAGSLLGKTILLFFAKQPSHERERHIIADLRHQYYKLKNEGHNFEIVFISADRNEVTYDDHLSSMPWLAMPFKEDQPGLVRRDVLQDVFEVRRLPMLVAVDPTGLTLNSMALFHKPHEFPWLPDTIKLAHEIDEEELGEMLTYKQCLILLMESEKQSVKDSVKAQVLPVAAQYQHEAMTNDGRSELLVISFEKKGRWASKIREVIELPLGQNPGPQTFIMDIPDQGGISHPSLAPSHTRLLHPLTPLSCTLSHSSHHTPLSCTPSLALCCTPPPPPCTQLPHTPTHSLSSFTLFFHSPPPSFVRSREILQM
jgi:hypothetical protein